MSKRAGDFLRALAVVLLSMTPGPVAAETPRDRGAYLALGIMACDHCHTPRAQGGLDVARRFSGGPQVWDEPAFTVRGSNITPDPETGIGGWSAQDILRALVDGVRPDGTRLAPEMPFAFFRILTPADRDAVIAYLRSVPPVRRAIPPPVYKAAMPTTPVPGTETPPTEAAMRDPLTRGFYLATLGHCMECHTGQTADGQPDYAHRLGAGGQKIAGPWGIVVAPNITSDAKAGLGGWSDAEIRRALTQSVGRDGHRFKAPMARGTYLSRLTDQDLAALILYLRSLPPLS